MAPEILPASSQAQTIRTVLGATQRLHAGLSLTGTLEAITQGVTTATGFTIAAVKLREPDGSMLTVAVFGSDGARDALLGTSITAEQWARLLHVSEARGQLRYIPAERFPQVEDMPTWRPDGPSPADPEDWDPDAMLFAPLLGRTGEYIGLLGVDAPESGRMPGVEQEELLTLFAQHAATAVDNALMYAELLATSERLAWAATHDALTGLRNRTILEDDLPRAAATPERRLIVAVIDLDGFKRVNDTAGHRAGDAALVVGAARMRDCLQGGEILARTGGDEFLVACLHPVDVDVAAACSDLVGRLRGAFAVPIDAEGSSWQLDASVGTASARTPTDQDTLIAAADARMYADKADHSERRSASPVH